MKSTLSIILKNIVLFFLLGVSLIFIFSNNIGYVEIRYLFGGIGFLYIIASLYEAYAISTINQSANKIPYFTYGFIAKRLIKVIVFCFSGVLLYFSGSIIKYFSFVCFLVAGTEILVVIFRYVKGLSYIAFDKELLIVSTNKLDILHAGSIQKIESRHGLTYFLDKNNKTFTLRSDILKDIPLFQKYLNEWIENNNIKDKVVLDK
jgi:hypothetical protein